MSRSVMIVCAALGGVLMATGVATGVVDGGPHVPTAVSVAVAVAGVVVLLVAAWLPLGAAAGWPGFE